MFSGYRYALFEALETVQCAGFKNRLVFVCGDVSEGHENGVAGMVVAAIERFQLFIAEVRNVFRIAAAVEVISDGREQMFAQGLPERARHRAHGALHLVEHDTLEYQIAVGISRLCEFNTVTLLGEVQWIKA